MTGQNWKLIKAGRLPEHLNQHTIQPGSRGISKFYADGSID